MSASKTLQSKFGISARWLENSTNRARFVAVLVGVLVTLIWCLRVPPFAWVWGTADTALQDAMLRVRVAARSVTGHEEPPRDVVLLTIDDESMRALGAYPPLPRQVYAHLCHTLEDAGAAVIGFQIVFDGTSPAFSGEHPISDQLNKYIKQVFGRALDKEPGADDAALVTAFEKKDNIVLGTQIDFNVIDRKTGRVQVLTPNEKVVNALRGGPSLGNVAIQPDPDGVVRSATIYGDKFPGHFSINTPFALRVAEKKFHSAAVESDSGVFLHDVFVPHHFRIDFAGPAGTFETIPLWKALELKKYYDGVDRNSPDAYVQNPFANKIVLVGYQDIATTDDAMPGAGAKSIAQNGLITPIGGISKPMSSAEVQANIIANILSGKFLAEISRWQEILLFLMLTAVFAAAAGFCRGRTIPLLSMTLGLSAIWFALCVFAFNQASLLIPSMVPIIGIFGTSFVVIWTDEHVIRAEQRRRKTRLFRRLTSRQLADEIDKHQLTELGLAGKEAQITVLVCEVHNMPDLLDGKTAEQGIELANKYIQTISDAITANGGVIERYLNHGVVGVWGAPLDLPANDQAKGAAQAAMNISIAMKEMPDRPLCLIGISSGTAMCGMVGVDENALYTAMGRPVDMAFQLVGENRVLGTTCVVSDSAAKLLASSEFETRQLSAERSGERCYQLLGPKGQLSGALEEATTLYRQAMTALDDGNRAEAERLLESALRLMPDDGPSQAALASCRRDLKDLI